MDKFTSLFDARAKKLAQKFLDYYDGDQKVHVEEQLKKIRYHSFSTGMLAPRHRNITKMVVDKSGMLFNGNPPKLEVWVGDSVDEAQSAALQDYLEGTDWVEFFTNLDPVVRGLKTAVVLPYYIAEEDRISLNLLAQHNAAVLYNELTRQVLLLIYCTGSTEDGETYRVISPLLYQDILVNRATGEEVIIATEDNPYGKVFAPAFHDTNTPRSGFWNKVPTDLLDINDVYNVALSDSEYSAAWAKHETLFTNATVLGDETSPGQMGLAQVEGEALPRWKSTGGTAAIGGPGKIIQIDTNGVQSPFVEYKGPKPNLQPLDDMVQKWVMDFAADWSVNASMDASGADSGFKLLVRELPNLELRKKRQRMMEAGFKRLFACLRDMINVHKPGTFSEDAELFVEFSAPDLAIDEAATEDVWEKRIAGKRATRVDYFMAVHGMSKAEAEEKVQEIDAAEPHPEPQIAPQDEEEPLQDR